MHVTMCGQVQAKMQQCVGGRKLQHMYFGKIKRDSVLPKRFCVQGSHSADPLAGRQFPMQFNQSALIPAEGYFAGEFGIEQAEALT